MRKKRGGKWRNGKEKKNVTPSETKKILLKMSDLENQT